MVSDLHTKLKQLDSGMHVRLTLVFAQDGSPELLRHWLAEYPGLRARHVLTVADNVFGQFLAHLRTALRPVLPVLQPVVLSPGMNPMDATVELLNALLMVEEDFALVLENYQVITAPAVHTAINLIIDYPPPRMHLYLVSHATPPLPLARLRVRQQLVEVDLRPQTCEDSSTGSRSLKKTSASDDQGGR